MRKLLQAILLLVLLGGGFVFGAWLGTQRPAHGPSEGVPRNLLDSTSDVYKVPDRSIRSFQSDDELISAMMTALKEEDPLFRAHRLYSLFEHLSSAELAALFQRASELDNLIHRETLLGPVLARWQAVDPAAVESAMRPFLDQLHSGKRLLWGSKGGTLLLAWARVRPDAALATAMVAPESDWSKWMARVALESMSGGDPARMIATLREMPANSLRAGLSEEAINELAKTDTAAAEAQLDLISDANQRARAQCDIISSLAKRDPAAALARVSDIVSNLNSQNQGIRLVSAVVSEVASKDPHAALAATEELPEHLKSAAIGAALVAWIEQKPLDTLNWARENGVDFSEAKHIASFGATGGAYGWRTPLLAAFGKDPEQTLAWLLEEPPSRERDTMLAQGIFVGTFEQRLAIYAELTPENREKYVGRIVSDNSRTRDPVAAEAWVQSLPDGPERTAGIQGLVSLQLDKEPGRAAELIASYPPGPERDAATRAAIYAFNYTNSVKAMELAASISNPNLREAAYVNVVGIWISKDKSAAAAWLSGTEAIDPELKRVLLREAEGR
jgi:hypothetical protein